MAPAPEIVTHYSRDGVMDRIRSQLIDAGHDLATLDPDAIAGVDEFHLGGRLATKAMLESLRVDDRAELLDVGCGIGGVARTIARSTGCTVFGIDLTPPFVELAAELSALVGLADRTDFRVGSALDLPFDDDRFDAVTLVHVGMNIDDKAALFGELARVVRAGGTVHVYDIMRVGDGAVTFPVPWSSGESTSFVATPAAYVEAMRSTGLEVDEPVDRLDLVRTALAAVTANPPAVTLAHLMGEQWPTMFANLIACLDHGVLAPVEIVGHKP